MNARLMERVLEAQASNANIIDNISDMVVVQNDKGFILHLNGCASKYLEENERAGNNVGKYFSDVFPEFANLATEIAKVVEHRLDKSVSRGCPSYVILTEKNFRQEIERVILILHNINSETNPDDTMKK
jgi:nitrogen-specific signal transduction histidine kinase